FWWHCRSKAGWCDAAKNVNHRFLNVYTLAVLQPLLVLGQVIPKCGEQVDKVDIVLPNKVHKLVAVNVNFLASKWDKRFVQSCFHIKATVGRLQIETFLEVQQKLFLGSLGESKVDV